MVLHEDFLENNFNTNNVILVFTTGNVMFPQSQSLFEGEQFVAFTDRTIANSSVLLVVTTGFKRILTFEGS